MGDCPKADCTQPASATSQASIAAQNLTALSSKYQALSIEASKYFLVSKKPDYCKGYGSRLPEEAEIMEGIFKIF